MPVRSDLYCGYVSADNLRARLVAGEPEFRASLDCLHEGGDGLFIETHRRASRAEGVLLREKTFSFSVQHIQLPRDPGEGPAMRGLLRPKILHVSVDPLDGSCDPCFLGLNCSKRILRSSACDGCFPDDACGIG